MTYITGYIEYTYFDNLFLSERVLTGSESVTAGGFFSKE